MYLPYAGIGSRKTPLHILSIMTDISKYMANSGYTLRTGGCEGPDQAFELGDSNRELYVPWSGYEGRYGHLPTHDGILLASQFHPAWDNCSRGTQKMHGRNTHIMLGPDLNSKVKMVICWTPCGTIEGTTKSSTGGTGHALRIAIHYGITIFNLKREDHIEYWVDTLRQSNGVTG